MPHQLQISLEELKFNITRMSSLVIHQVQEAVNSLAQDSSKIYKEIKMKDDEIDAYDELIQVQCENIFALHQPIAYDLRYVMTIFMLNNQLERCGDIAVSIANRARKISSHRNLIFESGILAMAEEAQKMIAQAIDAFSQSNAEMANNIITNDDKVDLLNSSAFDYLTNQMKLENGLIEPLAHMLILSRQIERLADHATNIAEHVLFLIEAKVASHRQALNGSSDVKQIN